MRLLILSYIILVSLGFYKLNADTEKEWKQLSFKQKEVIRTSFAHGKPFNLGYSLASIAWQESMGGRYLINIFDPSYGIYHIKINNALAFEKAKNLSKFEKNIIASMLLKDHKYASAVCLSILRFWMNYHKGSWSKAISSYNGGMKGNRYYLKKIKKKVRFLKGVLK